MADRDRYDPDRGREFDRDREYGRGAEGERGNQDRGAMSRGADEVRSWFGDDEARRRREMDEQRDRQWGDRGERDYGPNSARARAEHHWNNPSRPDDARWESRQRPMSSYGDQRDFVGRGNDWSGNAPSHQQGSQWTGGSRDFGDEDTRRRYGNSQYSGGQSSPFGGGYGGGNYESGQSRGQGWPGYSGQGGSGQQTSFRQSTFGSDNYGGYGSNAPGNYGRDSGSTGEGRWGNSSGASYGGSNYGRPGGMFSGRGPRSYQRSDARVCEDVNERLTEDPRIDASEIDVHVQGGEVTLSGTVDDRRTRRLAEEIVEDLPGVRDVKNELRVSRGREWNQQGESHRSVGEQSRQREDGAIGHTGDPQQRDDVTTINTKDPKR